MKAKITSKMKMYKSVLEVCKNHESEWAEIPGFASGVNEFETKLAVLHTKSENQGTILMGVTNGKNSKYLVLVEHLQILHDALWIYGNTINDSELMARNKSNSSELKRLSITRLDLHLTTIIEDLSTHGLNLEVFGITSSFISETIVKIDEARISSTRPRMVIIERKMLTNTMNVLSKELDDILKLRLDKMIHLFKNVSLDFFNLYFNARVIIDVQGKTKGKVNPNEPSNEEPV